ncbi:unnamed protein product [Choristocarpus tenellus]
MHKWFHGAICNFLRLTFFLSKQSGKAYVCHQSKDDISRCRDVARAKMMDPNADGDPCSPWRDRPVEESLALFEDMRVGKMEENQCTLRLKMDMTSPNPNMWDQVAYRIRYIAHPHVGNKWCIYPTYDFTHCLVDSLEDIDYSICTLEFETRRESYYWLLEALEIYRPKVYEFARLNITRTVLSKRKLLKLIKGGLVHGWDDPRMPTIKGFRRRGYTPEVINAFCADIGVTRNENVIEVEKLEYWVRTILNDIAPRVMGVLYPIKVTLTNLEAERELEVPDIPFAPEKGSHKLTLTKVLYVDSSDFRREDAPDYYGLAPGKSVGLKHCSMAMKCDEVVEAKDGTIQELRCSVTTLGVLPGGSDGKEGGGEGEGVVKRPKGNISWVPGEGCVVAEVRLYDHLFAVDSPDDRWEEQLTKDSEVVVEGALLDPSLIARPGGAPAGTCFQMERIGFFVVDPDTSGDRLVINRTITLREAVGKGTAAPGKSRKEEQARQLAEKEARKNTPPEELFTGQTDLFSAFDIDGVPTHDKEGKAFSKSAIKKFRKDWDKQKKLYEKSVAASTGGKG